jgi:hypothetical protein
MKNIVIASILVTILSACGKTPVCDDSKIIQTLQNIGVELVNTGASPELIEMAKTNDVSKIKISNISTISHNKDNDSFICKASIRYIFNKEDSEILYKQEPIDEKTLHFMALHYGTLFYTKVWNNTGLAAGMMLANTLKASPLVIQDGDSAFVELATRYTIEKVSDDGKKDFSVDVDVKNSQSAVDATQHFLSYLTAYRRAISNTPLIPNHNYSEKDIQFKSKAERAEEHEVTNVPSEE